MDIEISDDELRALIQGAAENIAENVFYPESEMNECLARLQELIHVLHERKRAARPQFDPEKRYPVQGVPFS